jgi:hypothetical protein
MPHKPPALFLFAVVLATAAQAAPIDRQAVVARHNPHLTQVDPWSPLSVGNGRFAFTADVTGLQTFADHYWQHGTATETQARWSWHTNANPEGYKLSDANRDFTAHGRTLGYPTNQNSPAGQWLRENPHGWPLAQLALDYARDFIRVNALIVGSVNTRMTRTVVDAAGGPENLGLSYERNVIARIAEPAEIATSIAFLLSDDASFITGSGFVVDGGMTALLF